MKHTLFSFLLFFILFANAQTNWCPTGAQWTYSHVSMQYGEGYETMVYERDTVISGMDCKKVTGSLIVRSNWSPHPIDTIAVSPVFTYSNGDTVFMFYRQKFRPTYFFNAEVGDTMRFFNVTPVSFNCDSVINLIVDSTGTTVINNDTLRYYVAKYSMGHTFLGVMKVVERFGAMGFEFRPYMMCYNDGADTRLRCYSDTSFATYQTDPAIECDYIYTALEDLEGNMFSIYPNPATEVLTVDITGLQIDNTQLQVYDMYGKLLYSAPTQGWLTAINTAALESGNYVLKVSADGKVGYKKFLVVR